MTEAEQANKALVIEAFDTLFNRRDYVTAQRFWSPHYMQHSAHIKPGRDGLFDLVKTLPTELRYEHQLVVAGGDYVMLHGRFFQIGPYRTGHPHYQPVSRGRARVHPLGSRHARVQARRNKTQTTPYPYTRTARVRPASVQQSDPPSLDTELPRPHGHSTGRLFGGPKGNRTPDLLDANETTSSGI
jgi:hypothetical protein